MYSVKTLQQIGHYCGCNPLLLLHSVYCSTYFVTPQTPNCEAKLSAIAHAAATVYHHINLDSNLNVVLGYTRSILILICAQIHLSL